MNQEVTKHCPYCGEEILAVARKCKHCGEWLDVKKQEPEKKMINCPICGELIEEGIKQCPHCKENVSSTKVAKVVPVAPADESRSFFDYYLVEPFFRHYMKFRGRLNKKHYWMAMLIWFLVLVTLGVIVVIQVVQNNPTMSDVTLLLMFLWFFATLIPLYATAARRLRDADSKPSAIAWFLLVTASPFLMLWTCRQSEDEDIRTDGLEPDEPQTVKFKKSDKIVTTILALLFIIGVTVVFLEHGWSGTVDEDEMEYIEDDFEENDIIAGEEFDDTRNTDDVSFSTLLNKTTWNNTEYGFKVPDIMQKSEFFDENNPTTFEIYSWKDVILSFCFLGVWASSDEFFPVPGNVISQNCIIADLAYNFKSKIFSGHTTDGRIFYLKRIVGWPGEDIPHPYILALIYPPEYQDAVKPLIEIVRKWSAS